MDLRQHILNVDDKKVIPLEVPEWKTTVHLRAWTAGERASIQRAWREADKTGKGFESLSARVAVISLCDESGVKLFTDEHIPALQNKCASALELILNSALELNGLSGEAVAEAKKD